MTRLDTSIEDGRRWVRRGNSLAARLPGTVAALRRRQVSVMERAPGWIVYALHPVALAWFGLQYGGFALPTAAKPGLELGGLPCTSKAALFALMGPAGRARLPPFARVEAGPGAAARAREAMAAAGFGFPVVAKPDLGRNGVGVKAARGPEELAAHLAKFPAGHGALVQRLVDAPGEAGLLYLRRPGEARGRITVVTLKRFPEVVGDGRSTLRELILADGRARVFAGTYFRRLGAGLEAVVPRGERRALTSVGNHVRGSAFLDGAAHVTPALEAAVEAVAREIPGFHVGRLDVRYEDLKALERGEFTILELNGAGAEPTQVWDPRKSVTEVYAGLLGQVRVLFEVGAENVRRGARPAPAREIVRRYFAEVRRQRIYPDEE